jgi:polyketide cyclase/dehydrase/lipid transport protein
VKTSVAATAQSPLSPAELFDLLADPRGCVTWHDHPTKDRPQSTDAPPGLALAGAEYWSRGLCGTIAWRARTSVTAAERSRHYATETEIIYEHPRVPRARSSERFILEPNGVGSFVRYDTEVSQDTALYGWVARIYVAVASRLLVARSLRKNFHHVLRAAEAEAARSASTRT